MAGNVVRPCCVISQVTVNISFTFLNEEYADMHFMLGYAVVMQMLPLRSITGCFHNKKNTRLMGVC